MLNVCSATKFSLANFNPIKVIKITWTTIAREHYCTCSNISPFVITVVRNFENVANFPGQTLPLVPLLFREMISTRVCSKRNNRRSHFSKMLYTSGIQHFADILESVWKLLHVTVAHLVEFLVFRAELVAIASGILHPVANRSQREFDYNVINSGTFSHAHRSSSGRAQSWCAGDASVRTINPVPTLLKRNAVPRHYDAS